MRTITEGYKKRVSKAYLNNIEIEKHLPLQKDESANQFHFESGYQACINNTNLPILIKRIELLMEYKSDILNSDIIPWTEVREALEGLQTALEESKRDKLQKTK